MYVLDRLWRGEISPTERFVRPNSEYKKTSKQFGDEIDALIATLSPEAKRQMEVVDRLRTDLTLMTEEDVFIYGFRMGTASNAMLSALTTIHILIRIVAFFLFIIVPPYIRWLDLVLPSFSLRCGILFQRI